VIADEKGSLAIAGIKGGSRAQVGEHTKNIVLEAANFEPVATRKTSRELKLQTDSSKRFENEITPKKAAEAIEAVTQLILEMTAEKGAVAGPVSDTYPNPQASPKTISVQTQDINKTLGLKLTHQEIALICSKLRLEDVGTQNDLLELVIPSDRLDLEITEDIIEEVGRVYGYDNIPTVLPSTPTVSLHPRALLEHQIRNILLKDGWSEVMTYTFTNKGDIEMANALASDKNFLRTNLADGFTESLEKNIKNAELFGADNISQFEIGSVFSKESQEIHLALGYRSNKKKDRKDLAILLKNINVALGLDLKGTEKDGVMEICLPQNPETTGSYQEAGIVNSKDARGFTQPSVYPFITRDVSVWLPEDIAPENLTAIFSQHAGELLIREPRLFDTFTKEGRTSYAYRLVFQAIDRTLTDNEVAEIMQKISHEIESRDWEER
jgi:phenylalanyl-tRNA synthetase beta subunit